ncbi:HlyD family secretion protein [Gilliamella sp. CG25]|uniref:HlyD family secretion protein n=1 Tax=unclassified Gilliamella TaxID=2685620 RepID=UPI003985EF38
MNKSNESNESLFRSECIENNKVTIVGQIMLVTPFSITLINIFFLIIFIAIIYLFIFFDYGRKIHVTGTLLPVEGVVTILSAEPSIVDQILVKENQKIKMGQTLFVLRNLKYSSTHDAVQKFLVNKKNSLTHQHNIFLNQNNIKKISLEKTLKNLEEEKNILQTQILVQSERVEIANEISEKFKKLIKAESVSIIDYNNKQSELLDQKSILFDLQQKLTSTDRNISDLETELLQIPLQEKQEISKFEQELSLIEKELIENEGLMLMNIVAPKDGVISTIMISKGQSIGDDVIIATLLPENQNLEANLFIPSSAIGFLKVGLPVSIRYDAFPYQKFGQHNGIINEISNNTLYLNELKSIGIYSQKFNDEKDAFYRVKVKLDDQTMKAYGKNYPLKVGMTLESNIILEKRKIYEWIFEPIFSIKGNK